EGPTLDGSFSVLLCSGGLWSLAPAAGRQTPAPASVVAAADRGFCGTRRLSRVRQETLLGAPAGPSDREPMDLRPPPGTALGAGRGRRYLSGILELPGRPSDFSRGRRCLFPRRNCELHV